MWHWVQKDLPAHVSQENRLILRMAAAEANTPMKMFMSHFDDDCVQLLVLESNRFRIQQCRTRTSPVGAEEMRVFMGICFYMSVVHLPTYRMYWAPCTRQSIVADAMTVNRFEEILSILHANDNDLEIAKGQPGYDRLHKVRPLLDSVLDRFKKCAEKEIQVSVDEQIIPFKGRHSLKTYMMKKTKKWGYKVWVQAGQSGYVHDFQFAGDNLAPVVDTVENVGKSGEVVVHLTADQPHGSYVYFDNYFASPELLIELKSRDIKATCTMRPNRSRKCPLKCLKDINKCGRGAYDYRMLNDESLIICEWFDNKVVLMGSNVHGVEPTHLVRRYDRTAKRHVELSCPAMIKHYNANMGGVDKCDMLLSLYRNERKSKKWYKRVIFHMLDLCLVNAWLLYRAMKPEATIPLAHFKLDAARGLITSKVAIERTLHDQNNNNNKKKLRSAKDVNADTRYDNVGHFPGKMDMENAQRCKANGCSRKTFYYCRKCWISLCIFGHDGQEDCFYTFHHV